MPYWQVNVDAYDRMGTRDVERLTMQTRQEITTAEREIIDDDFSVAMSSVIAKRLLRLRCSNPAEYNRIVERLAKSGALGGGETHGVVSLSTRGAS